MSRAESGEKNTGAAGPGKPQHVDALDGVRGLAILLVLAFHVDGGAHSGNALVRFLHVLLTLGWSGVTLFFVLSGFLITNVLWASRGQPHWLRTFLLRRSLRIFPLYYTALLLVLIVAVAKHEVAHLAGPLLVYALYLQNLVFPLGFSALNIFTLNHFWSLAVEEQFYLVWPFLLRVIPTLHRARRLCAVMFLVAIPLRWIFFHWRIDALINSTVAHMGELSMGGWLALTLREKPEWKPLLRRCVWPVFGATAIVLGICWMLTGTLGEVTTPMYVFGLAMLSLAFAALIVVALDGGVWARALAWKPLRHLGVISYSLYVFHILFYPLYVRLVVRMVPHRSTFLQNTLLSALMVALSIPLAELSYWCMERPLLRLKSRITPGSPPARVVLGKEKSATEAMV